MHNYDVELAALSVGHVPFDNLIGGAGLPSLGSVSTPPPFNADQVWADALEASKASGYQSIINSTCPGEDQQEAAMCAQAQAQIAQANFRGNRAANAIRDGLRFLGYDPGMNDTAWSGEDASAWKAFAADQNVPAGPGLVSKAGVERMEQVLHGGGGGGGGTTAKVAGIPWWGWALGAAGVVGVIAVASR